MKIVPKREKSALTVSKIIWQTILRYIKTAEHAQWRVLCSTEISSSSKKLLQVGLQVAESIRIHINMPFFQFILITRSTLSLSLFEILSHSYRHTHEQEAEKESEGTTASRVANRREQPVSVHTMLRLNFLHWTVQGKERPYCRRATMFASSYKS